MITRSIQIALLATITLGLITGCERDASEKPAQTAQVEPSERPNILFIVWDTARADRLSLYGHQRRTTPFLDEWSRNARVMDNCLTVGSTTAPSHASMFTGLMAGEHGVTNEERLLPDEFVTLAELLKLNGYATYMFSENPHVARFGPKPSFAQGFDLAEHPWSKAYRADALELTLRKLHGLPSTSHLVQKVENRQIGQWTIKAAGELAQRGVEQWLADRQPDQPFFVFLNYMEAHRPLIPPPRFREQIMTPEQVAASYRVNYDWIPLWSYVLGLREMSAAELELFAGLYDAALLELDTLLRDLLESLEAKGYLDNTVVVLVGDHGEHLGEHHMLDHQFSVYEPLMRVPLVIHYPPSFKPGRDSRPVMNVDLFPTLLELAGVEPPSRSKALSLLNPPEQRTRIGEYPAAMMGVLKTVRQRYPNFDPTPWTRGLRAYYHEPHKFIEASDGTHELYDLQQDPGELNNLYERRPELAQRLATELKAYAASLQSPPVRDSGVSEPVDHSTRGMLESLGYLQADEDEPTTQPTSGPATKPATQRSNP